MVLNRYLLDRLCSCLFLCGSDHALEEAFLFLRSGFGLTVQSLDIQYIDTADNGLYFLFHGNTFEDLLILNAPDRAETIKKLLTDKVQFRDCLIMDTRGVSSMYANDGGVIVTV